MVLIITGPRVEIADMINWRILRDKIPHSELLAQHYTTSTKLHLARRHSDKLNELIPTQKATDIMQINLNERRAEFPPSFLNKSSDYLSELDAFFYSLRSCVDSFLWEIILVFDLELSDANLRRIRERMEKKHKDREMTKLLNNLRDESWFKYLNDIRNYLTHRKLSEIATFSEDLKLYLPSDPKMSSYSREKKFEVIQCLQNLYVNTKDFLEKAYGLLIDESICTRALKLP